MLSQSSVISEVNILGPYGYIVCPINICPINRLKHSGLKGEAIP
jgi:hypothetical protein